MSGVVNFVTSSGENLLCLPFRLANIAIDLQKTISGIAATVFSAVTLGKSKQINEYSYNVNASYKILPNLHLSILKILNPNIEAEKYEFDNTGVVTLQYAIPIYVKAKEVAAKDTFWKKHIAARGLYVIGALAATITRTVDLVLGIFGAALSLITFGNNEKINDFTIAQLSSLGLIADISNSVKGFVNPLQFK